MNRFIYPVAIILCLFSSYGCGTQTKTTTPPGKAADITATASQKLYPICPTPPDCATLEAACQLRNGCPGEVCYPQILQCHSITQGRFDTLCQAFHTGEQNGPPILLSSMPSIINDPSICNYRIVLRGNERHLNNDDITVDTLKIETKDKRMEARYSLTFFRALIKIDAVSFRFFKAKKPIREGSADLCPDILVKAYNAGNAEVYCGDLSGLYP